MESEREGATKIRNKGKGRTKVRSDGKGKKKLWTVKGKEK